MLYPFLTILNFHSISLVPHPLFPDEMDQQRFDNLLGVLKKVFCILPLTEAYEEFRNGRRNVLALTFDDGYKDNFDIARPILEKHKLRATFFIASSFLNGGWMWNDGIIEAIKNIRRQTIDLTCGPLKSYSLGNIEDKRSAVRGILSQVKYLPMEQRKQIACKLLKICEVEPPATLMMSDEDIIQLDRSGMEIGGHTINHPILSTLSDHHAFHEIKGNKTYLEGLLGKRINVFAYPNGRPGQDYTDKTISIVKQAGYSFAVTTVQELASKMSDPHQLPRFTPWDRNPYKYILRIFLKQFASAFQGG